MGAATLRKKTALLPASEKRPWSRQKVYFDLSLEITKQVKLG